MFGFIHFNDFDYKNMKIIIYVRIHIMYKYYVHLLHYHLLQCIPFFIIIMYIFYTIINDLIHKHVKNAKIYYVIIIFMYVSLHNRRCLVAEWRKVVMTTKFM